MALTNQKVCCEKMPLTVTVLRCEGIGRVKYKIHTQPAVEHTVVSPYYQTIPFVRVCVISV